MEQQHIESRQTRHTGVGLTLILVGLVLLVLQFVPRWLDWVALEDIWPFLIIGVGGLLFVLGIVSKSPGTVVPGTILCGIGSLLLWQNVTGHWESWAYVWTLIPGFVGLGL